MMTRLTRSGRDDEREEHAALLLGGAPPRRPNFLTMPMNSRLQTGVPPARRRRRFLVTAAASRASRCRVKDAHALRMSLEPSSEMSRAVPVHLGAWRRRGPRADGQTGR